MFWFRFSDNEPGLLSSVFVFGSEVGKSRSKCQKKKVKTKKGDFQGKRLTDIWFYKVFLSFLSFINFLFVSLLAFLFICLSLLLFVCFRTRQKFEYLRLKTQEKTKKLLKFQRVQKVAKIFNMLYAYFTGICWCCERCKHAPK